MQNRMVRALKVAGLGLAPALLCFALNGCTVSGIRLRVENKSGQQLTNMKVTYTGGEVTIDRLKSGSSYKAPVTPTAKSYLHVEFLLANGEKITKKLPAEVEPGYSGELKLQIIENGGIGWSTHLAPGTAPAPKGMMVPPPPPPGS